MPNQAPVGDKICEYFRYSIFLMPNRIFLVIDYYLNLTPPSLRDGGGDRCGGRPAINHELTNI